MSVNNYSDLARIRAERIKRIDRRERERIRYRKALEDIAAGRSCRLSSDPCHEVNERLAREALAAGD